MSPAEQLDAMFTAWCEGIESVPFPTWQVAEIKESIVEST